MKCSQRNCNNDVVTFSRNKDKEYCTLYCKRREAQLVKGDKALQKLKDKYSIPKKVIMNKDVCKYCKDSNHETFCCDEHEKIYNSIMSEVNKAMGR